MSPGLLGLKSCICKVEESSKMMPKASSGLMTTNQHLARGIHFLQTAMTGSRLHTLGRQSYLPCNVHSQLLRLVTLMSWRMTVKMLDVLSPRRSCFVLPCFKIAVSRRDCCPWMPSNLSSQCGILVSRCFFFLVSTLLLHHLLFLLQSSSPKTNFGINSSQVESDG